MRRLEEIVASGPRRIPFGAFGMQGAGYSDHGIWLLVF